MSEYTTDDVIHEVLWSKIDEAKPEYRAKVERWLAEVERAASARGWDEGREVGYNDAREYHLYDGGCGPDTWDCGCDNPYRRNEGEKA